VQDNNNLNHNVTEQIRNDNPSITLVNNNSAINRGDNGIVINVEKIEHIIYPEKKIVEPELPAKPAKQSNNKNTTLVDNNRKVKEEEHVRNGENILY
jgi:hypothetical protein